MVIQKCEESKKWIFSKNCLTLFVSGREKKNAFSLQLSVLAKFFLTKTVQSTKHYKSRGFSGNCKKAKMTPFFGKGCFLTWLKKWVLLTVFLKSCVFPENTNFIVFSAKHSFSKTKTVCWKKTENSWKIVGCFWTWQNGVFWGFVFWGFNVKRFVFGVSGIVWKVLKMLVFPNFWGVFWGGSLLFIWVWKV